MVGKNRLLLTGCGAPGGPGIIKALLEDNSLELHIADANPFASGRALHHNFVQIPKAEEESFVNSVLDVCSKREIDVLLPLVTRELEILAANQQRFDDAGIKVVVSNIDTLSVANNKAALMRKLEGSNIRLAKCVEVFSAVDLESAVQELGYPNKKICIKPSKANGSRGMRILDAGAGSFEAFFEQKPGNTNCTPESIIELFADRTIPPMLVMEYLPGEEYTVDALLDEGEPLVLLPRKRIAMNNGISVAGIFEKHEEIIAYSTEIFRCLKLHGPNGLQVKQGEDGHFYILEINPRLQGTTTAAIGMGINLPLLSVKQAMGEDVIAQIPEPKWGLRFARFYENAYFSEN
jgi:carbamoyl-phosphate synthase large subunit